MGHGPSEGSGREEWATGAARGQVRQTGTKLLRTTTMPSPGARETAKEQGRRSPIRVFECSGFFEAVDCLKKHFDPLVAEKKYKDALAALAPGARHHQ